LRHLSYQNRDFATNLNTFDEKLTSSFEDRKKFAEFKFAALIVKKIFRFKRQD